MTAFPSESRTADAQLDEAGMNLLGMFVAVCGAPDDSAVADRANEALATLDGLVTAARTQAGR